MPIRMKKAGNLQLLILSILFGAAFGIGLYTFIYAKGFSYLSDNPDACKNCHVMNTVFEDWMRGGHRHAAACNDCHVPAGLFGKMLVKSINGFNHSFAFTFYDVPVAIHAVRRSKNVVQDNCVRCHGEMAAHAVGGPDGRGEALQCITCHREAGHRH